jgi:hypothetical protein
MLLVTLLIAVGLIGLLFYKKPLRIDRSDLAPPKPLPPKDPPKPE